MLLQAFRDASQHFDVSGAVVPTHYRTHLSGYEDLGQRRVGSNIIPDVLDDVHAC